MNAEQPPRDGASAEARAAAVYRERVQRFEAVRDAHAVRSRTLGTLRVAAFVGIILTGLWLERSGSLVAGAAVAAAVAAFFILIVRHRRVRAAESWHDALAQANRQGLQRLAREWSALPASADAPAGHPYARDIDILGRASLRQLLGATASVRGEDVLRDWLLAPASPVDIAERQQAVRDLAPRNELRDAIAAHAVSTRSITRRAIEDLLGWGEDVPWLSSRRWLRPLALLMTAVTWTLIALDAAGVLGSGPWLLAVLANYVLTAFFFKRIHATYDRAFARESVLENMPPLLEALESEAYAAPLLVELRRRLDVSGSPPHRELRRLVRLMEMSEVRRSTFTYLPVQLLTLWDFHLLAALERWQRRVGPCLRDWLEAAANIEALAALATLAHDHDDWCYPVIDVDCDRYEATALAHPLIPDAMRVGNDVGVGPPGTFLLVTGSNMSGKSTLLRAIGVNAVLAQAGAPACAAALRMPPLDVWTSVRIDDSLAEGVSLFMAELHRMKEIVDAAAMDGRRSGRRLLFLLDEILHGTNTAERRIAARRVIRHLLEHGAIGAVTTHDLELAEEPVLEPVAHLVHFQETFEDRDDDGGGTLRFDYRLRQGLATSTNALKLMKLVGLPAD
jgi:hypothetical protein